MKTRIAYHYNPDTKIFDSIEDTPLNPLESQLKNQDIWLLGADCTFIKPPDPKSGYNIIFNTDNGNWEYSKIEEIKKEVQLSPEENIRLKIYELESYLYSTDWYVIRFADTGEPVPDDIKQQRKDARAEISRLRESISD